MNDVLKCKFKNCEKFYLNPVVLPCLNNICKEHVNDLSRENALKIFKCQFCNIYHEIPDEGFPLNRDLVSILSLNLHLTDKEKILYDLLCKYENYLSDISELRSKPENFIHSYVENVKNKIAKEGERLKEGIDLISQHMHAQLKLFEDICMSNQTKINIDLGDDNNEENEEEFQANSFDLSKLKNDLERSWLNDDQLDMAINRLDKNLQESKIKLISYKNSLLIGKGCFFKPGNFQISQPMFGELLIDEIVSVKLMESLNGFTDSRILNADQALALIELCAFQEKDKFCLVYRGTEDGFLAEDFHRKCDGIAQTIIIVKVKDSKNIFGGYTNAAWDCSNSYKEDRDAYLFSLLNKDNKPIKMPIYQKNAFQAIYCSDLYGPVFGNGNDFHLCSESDIKKLSYSNLGDTFKHPLYSFGSNGAKNILAGSYYFNVSEIEVYRLLQN